MSRECVCCTQTVHLEILCWKASEINKPFIGFSGWTHDSVGQGTWCRELLMGCSSGPFLPGLFSGSRGSQHFPEHPSGLLPVTELLGESHWCGVSRRGRAEEVT